MSDHADTLDAAVKLTRLIAYAADLEWWYRLPWYQRIITPKPQMPKD
jgi:hypothetical protein